MYQEIINGRLYLGVSFDLASFPDMIEAHRNEFPNTENIENEGRRLFAEPNIDCHELQEFIRAVCNWGNYAGIAERVFRNNDYKDIVATFTVAREALNLPEPDIALACFHINRLHGLGISFASKHLRFMSPNICPVYDSILMDALPYPSDHFGYECFANDCRAIAEALTANGIANPIRENGQWYACDVEAAIYITVRC